MKESEKRLRADLSLENNKTGRKNYSIKAGAGGGKTTLLSRRICNQIASGTPIDKFVIITYTNAAAAELREKIGKHLQEIIGSSGDDIKNGIVQTALNNIELMEISTIHSFLLKILRENAFESGVALGAKKIEDDEDNARKKAFFDEWFETHYFEIYDRYGADWDIPVKSANDTKNVTRNVLLNMFMDIANVRENIMYDTKDHTQDFKNAAAGYVDQWLPRLVLFKKELLANRPVKKDRSPKKLNKDPQSIVDLIAEAEAKEDEVCDKATILSKALKKIKTMLDSGKSFYGAYGDNSALTNVIPEFPEWDMEWDFETLYNTFMLGSQRVNRIVEYACEMQKEYQKRIDNESLYISDDDILFRAGKLLETNAEVLDMLRTKYSKIYVDEFQDTTGLQAKIIRFLSEKPGTKPGSNDLQDDKLVIVGDSKQSIYRFTGAEKAVYDEFDSMIAGLSDTFAGSVSLDTNFRSNKDIVDWVNDRFARLMPAGYSVMDSERVVSEKKALHGVYRYEPDLGVDENGKPVKYKKEDDVDAVAGLVCRLVDDPDHFIEQPVRNTDGSDGKPVLRKIKYSDIMIICKVTTNIKNYVEKFAGLGIPVNVKGRFKVFDDEVLKNFCLLTEYFAGYKNKKKRIAAVQIIGGSDATNADQEEIKKAEGSLRELRRFFRENSMDTAAIMRYLLSHEELFLPKGREFPIERVREYRIRLNQMVETCLTDNNGDISRLSELMKKYMESDVKQEIPLESNENAVRLMNVHQAKGLTGGIVIIADRSNEEKCRYSGFKSKGKYYPSAVYRLNEKQSGVIIPSFGMDISMLKKAYEEERQEAVRLQYVAATRAAHALIIMPAIRENVWFSDRKYFYDSLPDINVRLKEKISDAKTYQLESDSMSVGCEIKNLQDLMDNKASADLSKLSEKRIVSITPSLLESGGVTGLSPADKGYKKEVRPGGNVFGTVMHRVYELLFLRFNTISGLSDTDREKAIERIVNQAILENKDEMHASDSPKEFFDYLTEKMTHHFDKIITPVMSDADEVWPEYTFSFYVNDEEKDNFTKELSPFLEKKNISEIKDAIIWINGQADLVVKKKDGSIMVYDHKSDAMNGMPLQNFEKNLEEKYKGQLVLYRYAIGKVFGNSEVMTELIHLYR